MESGVCAWLVLSILGFALGSPLSISLDLVPVLLELIEVGAIVTLTSLSLHLLVVLVIRIVFFAIASSIVPLLVVL